nr:hypothetical protein [Butyrivibrio sp.]
ATDVDAMMAAMATAEAEPAAETPAEEPVAEMPAAEIPAEEPAPAENLDAILNAEIAALEGSVAAAEAEPAAEMPAEAPAAEMPAEEPVLDMPIEEPAAEPAPEAPAEEPVAEPALDMPAEEPLPEVAAEMPVAALSGAVEDIESFLNSEDYEYTKVVSDGKNVVILKKADGTAMAIIYDGEEFEALESCYDKDGKSSYADIMNAYVKETIKAGGAGNITRHKGSKNVAG